MPITPTKHTASQADGKTKLSPRGEVHITLSRGSVKLPLDALVVEELDSDVLVGMPFMKSNNIDLHISSDKISLGKESVHYNLKPPSDKARVYRSQSFLLRASSRSVVLPGEFLEVKSPDGLPDDVEIAVEPRSDSTLPWPTPNITQAIAGTIRIANTTEDPVIIKPNHHLAQVHFTQNAPITVDDTVLPPTARCAKTLKPKRQEFSTDVSVDPNNLLKPLEVRAFEKLHSKFNEVFDPSVGTYNDASGRIRAHINMGPVDPPPQKGRLPSYQRKDLEVLQDKMDQLEDMGVLAKPETVNVKVEYVSPSFLVKKPGGDSRLVTAFTHIASYTKPLPSRATSCDDVLRFLAQYRYMIKTDMTKQFYQLPMESSSMKYLGVLTPYKGMRVYTRAAMGMPGSTEHLD